jgi:prepilin-type N-terminal cleavage/methylation domain-containing protein
MKRLRRVVREVSGYSLVELLTVMVILGVILGSLTTAFVSGSAAEMDANRRVQAQIQATIALDRLRKDIHCASSTDATPGTPTSAITLTGCGSGNHTWRTCQGQGGAPRWALYRDATACPSSPVVPTLCKNAPPASNGKLYADCLTAGPVFTYTAAGASLAKVQVDFNVNVNDVPSAHPHDSFELKDGIVLRNSSRL